MSPQRNGNPPNSRIFIHVMAFTTQMSYVGEVQPDLPHPFAVHVVSDGASTIIQLQGELDIATEDDLSGALAEALAARPRTVAVDLRSLVFLDSTGLRALLRLRESCSQLGCDLQLIRGIPSVQRVFEVSGVAAHFAIADEVPQQLEAAA